MKIITYNIHSAVDTDHVFDPGRIIGVLRDLDADLAALQEITIFRKHVWEMKTQKVPSEESDFVNEATTALGVHGYFGCTLEFPPTRGRYGNAILSKYDFEHIEDFVLPFPANTEKRIAIIVKVLAPKPFYFVCLHLAYQGAYEGDDQGRADAVAVLMQHLREKHYFPALLGGDFNADLVSPAIRELHKECDVANDLAGDTPTCDTGKRGLQQIDFLACFPKGAFTIRKCEILDNLGPSDHKTVQAEIDL